MKPLNMYPKANTRIGHIPSSKKLKESLVDLHNNMLNYAFKLTQNYDKAKDLTQETILKALGNFDKYYDNVNFKGWVFTIMYNLFVNNYRQISRQKTILDQSENLYLLNLPQNSGLYNPESDYIYLELITALNSLKEDYKKTFYMLLSGYSYIEIAENMNLPVGTVKSRIFFARKRLQTILVDYQ